MIRTVDRDNYNGPDSSKRWIFKLINTIGLKSDDQNQTSIHLDQGAIAIVHRDSLFIGRPRFTFVLFKNRSSRRKNSSRSFLKFSL